MDKPLPLCIRTPEDAVATMSRPHYHALVQHEQSQMASEGTLNKKCFSRLSFILHHGAPPMVKVQLENWLKEKLP